MKQQGCMSVWIDRNGSKTYDQRSPGGQPWSIGDVDGGVVDAIWTRGRRRRTHHRRAQCSAGCLGALDAGVLVSGRGTRDATN